QLQRSQTSASAGRFERSRAQAPSSRATSFQKCTRRPLGFQSRGIRGGRARPRARHRVHLMPSSTLVIAGSEEIFFKTAAQQLTDCALAAVAARGEFHWVLSGGNTPRQLYTLMAEAYYRDRFPWTKTSVYWGDERCVPPDHPDSNFRSAQEALLSKMPLS